MARLTETSGGVSHIGFTDGEPRHDDVYLGDDPISIEDVVPEVVVPMPTTRSGELFNNADGTLYGANKLGVIASTVCMSGIDIATLAGSIDQETLVGLRAKAKEARLVNSGKGVLDACYKVCPIMQNLGYCPLEIGLVLPINPRVRVRSTLSSPLTAEAATALFAIENENSNDNPNLAKLKRRAYKGLRYFFNGMLQANWTTRSRTQEEQMHILDIQDHMNIWSSIFGPKIVKKVLESQPSLF